MEAISNVVHKSFEELRSLSNPAEFIDYLFPLICLSAIEERGGDVFNIPEGALWTEVIRNGQNLGERLNTTFRELEEVNSSLKNVFSNVSFTQIEDSVLHNLTLHINQITKDDLGVLADEVLLQYAKNAGMKSADHLTPYTLTDLMIEILDIRDGSSVYDPTVGTAQSLIRSTKVAKELSLYGQEKNNRAWALAKMNAMIHNKLEADIRLGDTLRNPLFIDEKENLKTFDYILMDPPYGLTNWGYEEAKEDIYGRFFHGIPPKSRGDLAFILQALTSLNENGKAAILISNGALFRGGTEGKIRQEIIDLDVVEGVIGLPTGLLYSSGIAVSILILNKQKAAGRKGKILFIDAQEEYEQFRRQKKLNHNHCQKVVETFHQGNEIDKFSKFIPNEKISDSSLAVNSYFDEEEIDVSIGKVYVNKKKYEKNNTIPLKNIATLFRGMNTPSTKKMKDETPTHRLVELSHVHDGKVDFESLTTISTQSIRNVENYELLEGDVILSSRGTAIKIAVIPELEQPTLLSNHFICIRPNRNVNSHFLKAFLESPLGMFYLVNSQKGSTVTILTNKDIEDIPVPDVPKDEQENIATGFIQSDKEYEERLKEAQTKHAKAYEALYEKMGLTDAYQLID